MTENKVKHTDKYFSKERLNRILPSALVTVGIFLMLFIAGPLEIFANNINEFRLPLNSFVGYLILYFFVAVIVSFSALFFTPRKVYIVLYIIDIFMFVMLFLQSSFLNFGTHSLPGDNLSDEGINAAYIAIDVILWCIILAGLILAAVYIKKKGVFPIICLVLSIALVVAQFVGLITTIITAGDLNSGHNIGQGSEATYLTTQNLTTVSKNRNVFVFCVDRFDGKDFAEPVMEEHPEVFENLTGFTYFKDNISIYGHTYPALTNMVTNVKNGSMGREEYFDYAYNNNKTISELNKRGYLVNVFTDRYYAYETNTQFPDYISNAFHTVYNFRLESPHKVAWLFIRMQMYKCLPLPLKTVLMQDLSSNSVKEYVPLDDVETSGEKVYSVDMKFVYDYVTDTPFETVDDNVYSMVHLSGCHEVKYDENWNLVNTNLVVDMYPSIKNSFSIIDKYIDALKACGAYENATIIITGDHSRPHNDVSDKNQPSITGMFVKPSGVSEGSLKVSSAQVSHDNIWATIFQSENIPVPSEFGHSMFDISETETTTRTYIWDYNVRGDNRKQSIWEVQGNGHDFDNWTHQDTKTYGQSLMDSVSYYLCLPLGYVMKFCQMIVSNYGVAIILFTLLTKLVLLPLSVWIQKNSILMVKIQPEINFLKARLAGNVDAIADEQSKLFKRERYHPMVSIIPLVLQILLLLAVVDIIYHPLNYLYGYANDTLMRVAQFLNLNTGDKAYQLQIVEAIKNGTLVAGTEILGVPQETLSQLVYDATSFKLGFLGVNLSAVPSQVWGWYVLVPILAGASSWVLCFTQNAANVLQHEQNKWNKYGIMALSVALSLYLGLFVPSGIALYWMASNLLSVAQMYLLNLAINPKKYVDYEALEESRKALAESREFGKVDKKSADYKENKKREKADYKAFMNVANKHVVIYSEKSGFYKYYEKLISELLARSNLVIHYVTNDPKDVIFQVAQNEPRIKPYYIGLKKMMVLMMLATTDMFLLSTPELDKYYLKRSMMKKDIEYVYVPHDMMSVHMGFPEGALDAFDTVLCTGPHVVAEMQRITEQRKLKPKNLVEFGYPLADLLEKSAKDAQASAAPSDVKEILIAPSWQEDNLLDSCVDTLIEKLMCDKYHITVRPHPEYSKRYGMQLEKLVAKYADADSKKLSFELDFSANKSIYTSDLLITDWSGVGPEFCFATKRPALFVNTKIKCLNENWEQVGLTPVEISLRNKLGKAVEKSDLENVDKIVEQLFKDAPKYKKQITQEFDHFLFHHGCAAEYGAKYVLRSLYQKQQAVQSKKKEAKQEENQ